MSSAERGLEEELVEAGNRLLKPPSSVDELLPLLDQVENLLSRVEQSPSKSMQTALSPSMKALVADELLRHPDVDVKVSVASCISEITRITAPDAPYDDDRMKDVFQLIVSSFENLSDKSSISYNKRTLILETVAKVRSCVVMLDLECDGLIVEMFQHFLKAIRDYHPENVFSSMETIMTLVLEESEDISFELISPILASVKRDNEEVLPIARKLGKRVFENCAAKLKPYLIQARKSLGLSLDDYSKVIASICNGTTGAVGHSDDNACGEQLTEESNLARASSEGAAQADEIKLAGASTDEAAEDRATKESVTETCPEGDHPTVDGSLKSAVSNGIKETGNENRSVEPESLKKLENAHQADQSVETDTTSNAKPDDLDGGEIVKSESKSEQTSKKRGRKPNSVINSMEPSDSSRVDSDKEPDKAVDHRHIHRKEVRGSPPKEPSAEVAVPSENENETVEPSSPKALESEAINVASPSPSGNVLDEGHRKKSGRPKKKENSIQEVAATADVKKASEGTSDSEVKPQRRWGKKAPAESVTEEKTPAVADTSKIEGGTSDSETKPLKQAARKVDARDNTGDGSSSKKQQDGKRRGRGGRKTMLENDRTKSCAKDDDKEMVPSPKNTSKLTKDEGLLEETSKTISKRKRTRGKEQASDTIQYDDSLVGKQVKVWWPMDQMYYYGVIDSFDSVKKKHKVVYRDGDKENLNLRKEKWKILKDDSLSDEEGATEIQSPDPSPELHKRKKAKSNSESSPKQGKEGSRGSGASSSKSKGTTATKSVRKSRDDEVDEKVKDSTLTSGGKSVNDSGGKSKDRSKKGSDKSVGAGDSEGKSKDRSKKGGDKSVGDASRSAGKSKDDDADTLKTMAKAKLDSPKTATKETPKTASKGTPKAAKSKGKGSQRGKNSNASGPGKLKSGSIEEKEAEGKRENSPDDTVKKPENTKVKSPDTSKAQEGIVTKSGKKRRRGFKS